MNPIRSEKIYEPISGYPIILMMAMLAFVSIFLSVNTAGAGWISAAGL
jgi:hypothetical protein